MKTVISIILLAILSCSIQAEWTVVEVFEIPNSASGLAYDGQYLYCGIYGVDGGNIYRIDPANGDYTHLFTGPQEDCYGLTYDGSNFWTTDHPGSSSDPAIAMQMDNSGNLISQFNLPDHYMSGIAYDNSNYWVSTYYPDPGTLYKLNSSGEILVEYPLPDDQPWDICVENSNLWVADYWGDALYKLDPSDGSLLESHASEGVDPAGIVYDGQYLWYCDEGQGPTDNLYKIDLGGSGTPAINVDITEYDYGDVIIGQQGEFELVVSNTGDSPLMIDNFELDNTDFYVEEGFPVLIQPSESYSFTTTFSPQTWGYSTCYMRIASNDPTDPYVDIIMYGYGLHPEQEIETDSQDIDFGDVRTGAYKSRVLAISNQGAENLIISGLSSDSPLFFEDDYELVLPLTLIPKEKVYIRIWFHSDTDGDYNGQVLLYSNDNDEGTFIFELNAQAIPFSQDMGTLFWDRYSNNQNEKIVSLKNFVDITGDSISEVLVADNDYTISCLSGNSSGAADRLWNFSTYIPEVGSGSIYQEQGLAVIEDINDDGISDVIAGTAWGSRAVFAIDGQSGEMIWMFDTHQYGDGGWVYQVDATTDYNDDGISDVLAAAGDDGSGTGPKCVFCLDGSDGSLIWRNAHANACVSVIAVEDLSNDGVPDAISGESANGGDSYIHLIDGADGSTLNSLSFGSAAIFALADIPDGNGDGIRDFCFGTSTGSLKALTSVGLNIIWEQNLGYGTVTRFESIEQWGEEYILPSALNSNAYLLDAHSGDLMWSHPVSGNVLDTSPINDVNGDGHFDVLCGSLPGSFYILSGLTGEEIYYNSYSSAVDQILAIDDLDGNGTQEFIVGMRNSWVHCYSGGDESASGNILMINAWCNNDRSPDGAEVICNGETHFVSNGRVLFTELTEGETYIVEVNKPFYEEYQNEVEITIGVNELNVELIEILYQPSISWEIIAGNYVVQIQHSPSGYCLEYVLEYKLTTAPYFIELGTYSSSPIYIDWDQIPPGEYLFRLKAVYTTGHVYSSFLLINDLNTGFLLDTIPLITKLFSPHPNPFNPVTTINYSIENESLVELSVYNLTGEKVKTLVNERKEPGSFSAVWDGKDNLGRDAASGIYFVRLVSGEKKDTKKVILLK